MVYVDVYVRICSRLEPWWALRFDQDEVRRGRRRDEGTVIARKSSSQREGVDLVAFQKGQRKDDVTQKYVRKFTRREGVLYVGKAQEKARVMRTERRCSRFTGGTYPWIVESGIV